MTNKQAVLIATLAAIDGIIAHCTDHETMDMQTVKDDLGQLAVIVRRLVKGAK